MLENAQITPFGRRDKNPAINDEGEEDEDLGPERCQEQTAGIADIGPV